MSESQQLFFVPYLDEDVDLLVAKLIHARGFAATTTHEVGRLTTDDASQLAYATQHGMVIVTHNQTHYEQLAVEYFEANQPHGGVIISIQRSPYEVEQLLTDEVLNVYTSEEMQNRLLFV